MINQGDRVIVEYRGKLDDGTEFASTKVQGEPLEFVAGSGVVLPDFDYAVMGMDVGETRSIHIPADRAYGQRDEALVISMPVTSLPNGEALPVGAMLGIRTPEGDVMRVRVLEVGDEEVVLDCNHELAGQNLNFGITLVDVVSETPIEHELHPEGCACGCDRLQESLAAGEH